MFSVEASVDLYTHASEYKKQCRAQSCLRSVLGSQAFEAILAVAVGTNLLLLVTETNLEAQGADVPAWLPALNSALCILYAIELCTRMLVYRRALLLDNLSIIDAMIVVFDVASLIVTSFPASADWPSVGMMRLVRLVRLARSHKIIRAVPELSMQVQSLIGAVKPLFFGVALVLVTLTIFSILAVQIIHPLNKQLAADGVYDGCERCPRAFESVFQAALTFTQSIIAGDSWGAVSLVIIEHYPPTIFFFGIVFCALAMMVLNVILASVVDSATQARQRFAAFQIEAREEERAEAQHNLLAMCANMDTDSSGKLDWAEVNNAYVDLDNPFSKLLRVMDIEAYDLEIVWSILDDDSSGDVDYAELVEQLYKMKSKDSHTLLVFIRHYVQDIRKKVQEEMQVIKLDVLGLLRGNSGILNEVDGMVRQQAALAGEKAEMRTVNEATARAMNVGSRAFGEPDFENEMRRLLRELCSIARELDSKLELDYKLDAGSGAMGSSDRPPLTVWGRNLSKDYQSYNGPVLPVQTRFREDGPQHVESQDTQLFSSV